MGALTCRALLSGDIVAEGAGVAVDVGGNVLVRVGVEVRVAVLVRVGEDVEAGVVVLVRVGTEVAVGADEPFANSIGKYTVMPPAAETFWAETSGTTPLLKEIA